MINYLKKIYCRLFHEWSDVLYKEGKGWKNGKYKEPCEYKKACKKCEEWK